MILLCFSLGGGRLGGPTEIAVLSNYPSFASLVTLLAFHLYFHGLQHRVVLEFLVLVELRQGILA